jgi:phytol kinase
VIFGTVSSLLVLYAVSRGDGFPFYEAMARPSDAPHRRLFILVPLATTVLGGVLANVLFAPFAPVGYMVTGWGDAVGEPVGTRWGKHRYRVPSLAGVPVTRSLEGSAAVLVVGTAAAVLVLGRMGFAGSTALGVGVACGVVCALVEALSSHGLDNLTVQMAAAGVVWALLH